ncbi:MAG: DNA gyrase subunit A [Deltaproteobacteria bacterium]|nr:DNA gyrase subunit A [Deltaproteobacteria bacterium]
MDPIARTIVPIRIQDEMRNSYMDYSMSVIIGRALPDVRDGLKPVHRRILYAMHREGMGASKRYSKCAGVVGEVLKKYHPHGDSAVYDALVRMAQPWNLRYLLVDGQGNFGSVDGDSAAAYRYTECRMTRLAEEMLVDIDKETVSFSPNFDGNTEEPDVLPARLPNLLVNGADGIAVGMATKIPPHNLGEVIDACVALIEDPDLSVAELMRFIPAPDFPTAGTIYGRSGVRAAYESGRGRVLVRGNTRFEDLPSGRRALIIDEIPYQVNKARLIEQIADLVREKRLEGIRALRDESDRSGMRIVVELKRDVFEEVVLNHLYKHTALQSTFGVILLAIVDQRPQVLTLKEMLQHYIGHRRDVILHRARYELRKAQERAHLLEGYRIALDNLDEVIALIRASADVAIAREALMGRFEFSEVQANAILEMRLQRLTGLERQKVEDEYATILARIAELEEIVGSEPRLMEVVTEELAEIRDQYADERRTRIMDAAGEVSIWDLVAEEDQVVTISHLGYIKRCSPDEWRMQHRGGVGKKGMTTRDEDFVTSLFMANTHALLMVFTNTGKAYPLNVYEVPEAGRSARGRPIVNLVPVGENERITAVVSVRDISEESTEDLLFVSCRGIVKRTPLRDYRFIRQGGLIASGVAEDDELKVVRLIAGDEDVDVMLLASNGKCIRFPVEHDRPWKDTMLSGAPIFSRTARGNKGIALEEGEHVVDALLVPRLADETLADDDEFDLEPIEDAEPIEGIEDEEIDDEEIEVEESWETTLLTVTELGYGKRTPFHAYRLQNRAGKGIISHGTTPKTGGVVGALEVRRDDQLMLITDTGRVIRILAGSVRLVKSRASQGVRLMRLEEGERIVDMARVEDTDENEDDTEALESEEE